MLHSSCISGPLELAMTAPWGSSDMQGNGIADTKFVEEKVVVFWSI